MHVHSVNYTATLAQTGVPSPVLLTLFRSCSQAKPATLSFKKALAAVSPHMGRVSLSLPCLYACRSCLNNCNYVRLPPVFVCLASPSILLVFFCVFCPALPQLCTLLGFFSFSWFPFWVSLSSFLLLSPLLEPSLLFFFVVCQVPAGGRSCNTTQKKNEHCTTLQSIERIRDLSRPARTM